MKNSVALALSIVSLVGLLGLGVYVSGADKDRDADADKVIKREDLSDEISQALAQAVPMKDTGPMPAITPEHYIPDEDALRKLCEDVLSRVAAKDIEGAFALIGEHCPLPAAELATAKEQTETQLNRVAQRFGKSVGHELVKREVAGKSFLRLVYAMKCERHAIRWRFIFYKPGDKWLLNLFRWDDQIEGFF